MPTDPFLYTKRFTRRMIAESPDISQEQYMAGYDRTNSVVNSIVGIANEVARIAISDGMDAIKAAGLYHHKTKQLCNETLRRQEHYETLHNRNFGERSKLWLDYLDGAEDGYRRHIFNVYMSIKQLLDRHRESNSELKARLECGRICAMLAVAQFDITMDHMREKYGVDYTPFFIAARYSEPLYTWQLICNMYLTSDRPDEMINLNDDENVKLSMEILSRKLNDEDLIERICKHALDVNPDLVRKLPL